MKRDLDVVVVGAGPAGALSALMLARGGRQVAMLDKSASPRPKVCASCINPSAWELFRRLGLEEGFKSLPHHRITGIAVERGDYPMHRVACPAGGDEFRSVERSILDGWLIQEARNAGVDFYPEARVQDIKDDGRVIVAEGTFRGRVLIGADGRNSIVARASELAAPLRTCKRVAWQSEIPADVIDDDYHIRFFPEGYYVLVRIDSTRANLCLILHPGMSGTPHLIAHRYFPKVDAKVWQSLTPISRPASHTAQGNIWLVGDAAKTVEPITAEGIYLALASAEQAARALLSTPADTPDAAAEAYRVAHGKLYNKRLGDSKIFQWILERPGRGHFAASCLRHFPRQLERCIKRTFTTSENNSTEPNKI